MMMVSHTFVSMNEEGKKCQTRILTQQGGRVKKRTTVWLPQVLLVRLKKLSRKTGAPMAELFRRSVEAYLKRQK
jgi:hypothetical protein